MFDKIKELLADQADYLLKFDSPKIPKDQLSLPGPDFVDRVLLTQIETTGLSAICNGCSTTAD